MATNYSITEYFDKNLAELLSEKIEKVYPYFNSAKFINFVDIETHNKTYTQRISIIADLLQQEMPKKYENTIDILISILGEENPNQTGMFKNYYWIMPIGKFISTYGINNFEVSIKAIEEVTKRNTGEYAIRPFIIKYPDKTVKIMKEWAKSSNFHLRRLASEGLRPKLPWATKLDIFINQPEPVFEILTLLDKDEIMFVKKSVANHLTDWLKVNKKKTLPLIEEWKKIDNQHTKWIIKRATRLLNCIVLYLCY